MDIFLCSTFDGKKVAHNKKKVRSVGRYMLQDFISSMIQNNNITSNILTAVMSQI